MLKKSLLALSLLVFSVSAGNNIKTEPIKEEKCYVDISGNVICESEILEG